MPDALPLPPLFRAYPELGASLPWEPLGVFPTPVRRLKEVGCANLWIKHDDQSSPVYGGNKVRKLEFIMAQARHRRKTHVVTLGGIGTNHGLATAIYCRQLGLACTLVLFPQPVTSLVKQNLRLFTYYHAHPVYRSSLFRAVCAYYLTMRLRYPGAYFLYAGGSNATGTLGFVNAAFELKAQIDAGQMPLPAVIFCPVGSNGTLAGLTLGAHLAGLKTTVVGVRVSFSHCGPFQTCTSGTVRRLMSQTLQRLRERIPALNSVVPPEPVLWHDYVGAGYGFPTRQGQSACHLLKEREGIVLDPTYTAKTFAAVLDYCRRQDSRSDPVLYWHTYNSVDLAHQAQTIAARQLPKPLQQFIVADETENQLPLEVDHDQAQGL